MPTPPLSDELAQQAADAYRLHGMTGGAAVTGLKQKTFESRVKIAMARGMVQHRNRIKEQVSVPDLPDEDIDIEELVEHRIKQFKQKMAAHEARKCVPIKIKTPGPIGILWFGDPHVDDDGTDIAALRSHTDLVNATDGLFAANVGDSTNNWTGRLAKLYAQQGTTARQAWALAEWFIKRCPWLVIIGGNHDLWSGAGDPMNWIARGQTFLHEPSEARFSLNFPNGAQFIVNSRHDFAGHSQWNPAHGPMKAAQLGAHDHLYLAGHKHISGYGVTKCPSSGRVSHSLLVGSYKLLDRYAKERGFRDQSLGPCVVTVIDPSKPETCADMCKVFWNPEEGADYLTWRRSRS
jgi:hypothetical protein